MNSCGSNGISAVVGSDTSNTPGSAMELIHTPEIHCVVWSTRVQSYWMELVLLAGKEKTDKPTEENR